MATTAPTADQRTRLLAERCKTIVRNHPDNPLAPVVVELAEELAKLAHRAHGNI